MNTWRFLPHIDGGGPIIFQYIVETIFRPAASMLVLLNSWCETIFFPAHSIKVSMDLCIHAYISRESKKINLWILGRALFILESLYIHSKTLLRPWMQ